MQWPNVDTVMSLLNTATTGARSCSTCKKRPAAMSLLADVAIPCPSSSRRGCAWISSCSSSATASTRSARAASLQVREWVPSPHVSLQNYFLFMDATLREEVLVKIMHDRYLFFMCFFFCRLQGSSVRLGSRRERLLNCVVLQEISPKQE